MKDKPRVIGVSLDQGLPGFGGKQLDEDQELLAMSTSRTTSTIVTSASNGENMAFHDVTDDLSARKLLPDAPPKVLLPAVPEGDSAPKDRFKGVYLIMLIHGIGILMPWNMFITANDYFVLHKFGGRCSEYSRNFLSYLGIAAQVPGLLLNLVNVVLHLGGSLTKRITVSIAIVVVMFVLTVVLAMLDSSTWPDTFFALTIATVVVLNSANGVYQNSVFGTAAMLPAQYSNAIVLGNNISGTLTALIMILSMALAPDYRVSAIYYFTSAIVILLICFDTYFVLPHCRFYRYYKRLSQRKHAIEHEVELHEKEEHPAEGWRGRLEHTLAPFRIVFKHAWVQFYSVFFVFFVTLTIFPAIQADIKPTSDAFKTALHKYFTPVTTFVVFNAGAMIGNLFPHLFIFPGPRWVWVPVTLRGLLIPYFMLCNYKPDFRTFPVYFDNDWAYVVMALVMSLTSGYFSSLTMMYAPRVVPQRYASIAGMVAALFLILGVNAGIGFSLVIAKITENLGPLDPIRNATGDCLA